MAELQNGDFALGSGGVADGWLIVSSTSGSEALPLESFEDGWGNTETSPTLFSVALGGGESRESFERLWGPADGSDPNLPDAVPAAAYTENASFQPQLGQVAAGPALDSFETWVPGPFFLDFSDVSSASTTIESFETGWGGDGFLTELTDGVTAESVTFYAFDPQTIENFDTSRIVPGQELITISSAPPPEGDYTAEINGIDFSTAATILDSESDIATDLASIIDTSSYPYAAEVWSQDAEVVVVRRLEPIPMLIKVTGPVGNGTDIRISTQLLIDNFWFMPLE